MDPKNIEVPWRQIEQQTLRSLIEEYLSRDGTYYGDREMTLEEKTEMVIHQLDSGDAVITWDLDNQSGDIRLKKD